MAGEVALREATGAPVVVSDLQMTYLGFGRVGPVQSRVDVHRTPNARPWALIDLVDTGADDRVMAAASARAVEGFAS
jgi:hypothetical protein